MHPADKKSNRCCSQNSEGHTAPERTQEGMSQKPSWNKSKSHQAQNIAAGARKCRDQGTKDIEARGTEDNMISPPPLKQYKGS